MSHLYLCAVNVHQIRILILLCVAAKRLQVNAEESSDELTDLPKVEEKLGAVPHGLSTDSEVVQRCARSSDRCCSFPLVSVVGICIDTMYVFDV